MPDLVCPECGEPARRQPPTIWNPAWGPKPAYTHRDGQPLCPVIGADGYQPAHPKPADHPGKGGHIVSLRTNDHRMTSSKSPHSAVPAEDNQPYGPWAVSWLPDRHVTRNQAITAMHLAEAVAAMQEEGRTTVVDYTHSLWPHIDNWAAELDITAPDAVARVAETEPQ